MGTRSAISFRSVGAASGIVRHHGKVALQLRLRYPLPGSKARFGRRGAEQQGQLYRAVQAAERELHMNKQILH
jgi:hypothetical protein